MLLLRKKSRRLRESPTWFKLDDDRRTRHRHRLYFKTYPTYVNTHSTLLYASLPLSTRLDAPLRIPSKAIHRQRSPIPFFTPTSSPSLTTTQPIRLPPFQHARAPVSGPITGISPQESLLLDPSNPHHSSPSIHLQIPLPHISAVCLAAGYSSSTMIPNDERDSTRTASPPSLHTRSQR